MKPKVLSLCTVFSTNTKNPKLIKECLNFTTELRNSTANLTNRVIES